MKKIEVSTAKKIMGCTLGFLAVMQLVGCPSNHQTPASTKSMLAERADVIAKNQVNAVAKQQLAEQPVIPPLSVNAHIKSAS